MRTEEQKKNIRALIRILEKNPMKYEGEYMGHGPNECCALGYGLVRCPDIENVDNCYLRSKTYCMQLDRVIEDEYGFNLVEQDKIVEINDTTEGWEEVIKLLKTYLQRNK